MKFNIWRNLIGILILLLVIINCQKPAPKDYLKETVAEREARMTWWQDAGFGMFIHWGVYSIPAGVYKGEKIKGIGEWIMDRAQIPIPEYEKFVKQFNPVKFNAEQWVQIAKDAGMKYIVITSKHHDGFCLWDSKVSEYDIMDATPFNRDILQELSQACKKAGIRLCFYHSIMDWHHPDAKAENFPKYREEYLKPQIKELVTEFEDIGVLWFDGEWIKEWTEPQGQDLYNWIRNLKPDIIINNRVGKGRAGMQGMNKDSSYAGDFGTPEQEILETGSGGLDWESCMTMNDTWGFKTHDHNWKSTTTLIHNLVDIAAKGGNYLLNVGPTSEGLIPAPSVERLAEMGEWMRVNSAVIHNTQALKTFKEGDNIRYVQSNDKKYIYAVSLNWPGKTLILKNVKPIKGTNIYLLGVEKPLEWAEQGADGIVILLPPELQVAESRPVKYAYSFKIEGNQ